jgi:DeoR/GlpR family transcriptional regulator of sugar metabolism
MKNMLAATSGETVLLADSSKLGASAVARSLAWENITTLVTDLNPASPRLDPYRALVNLL